jgi:hypothetical protein
VKGGDGLQQDYGMRIYDNRLGRFLSVDPITAEYPELTPYQFASNRPIDGVDQDGLEWELNSASNYLKQKAAALKPVRSNNGTIAPWDPSQRNWKQKWRDSKNILANITYDIANGLYTLPQQMTASIRNEDYITNIGGNVHRAHGLEGEKQRTKAFVDGATSLIPGAPAAAKIEAKVAKYADGVLTRIGEEITEHVSKSASQLSVEDKLTRYLLNPAHPKGGSKANWFEKALGFTKDNMDDLAKQIVFDPKKATQTAVTEYGTKFNQTISIKGANDKIIDVVFSWIKNNDGVVRLTSGIPTKTK